MLAGGMIVLFALGSVGFFAYVEFALLRELRCARKVSQVISELGCDKDVLKNDSPMVALYRHVVQLSSQSKKAAN